MFIDKKIISCPYCGELYFDLYNNFHNNLKESIINSSIYYGFSTYVCQCQGCGCEYEVDYEWKLEIGVSMNEITIERMKYDKIQSWEELENCFTEDVDLFNPIEIVEDNN